MNMLAIHQEALDGSNSIYHEFLIRFNKIKKCVHGFVEGKDDKCFYKGFIEAMIPDDWKVELWAAGNKDKVLEVYLKFNWDRFSKYCIAFFIDRDLSEYFKEPIKNDLNIYITDGYSIENSIVNRSTCERLLCEVLNLSVLPKQEIDHILDLFDEQLSIFIEFNIIITAWIIYWKQLGEKPCLNDIYMKHIFNISCGKVHLIDKPKGNDCIVDYLNNQCGVTWEKEVDLSIIGNQLKSSGNAGYYVRGKYLLWFLIEFAISVHKDICNISGSIFATPKAHISLSLSNGVIVSANRARIPRSLTSFIINTYQKHIVQFGEAV